MKRSIIYFCILAVLLNTGCNKMLDEEPKSILTPDFLKTAVGFQRGLDAAYAGNRMLWGNQDLYTITVIGTDEFKRGIDGNSDINNYSSGYNSGNGSLAAIWRNCYYFINACNGLLDFAPEVTDLDENTKKKILAEAKFLRAQYYFTLVQCWRDVTLNEHFNDQPVTTAKRDPQSKVYELIIKDLQEAIPLLPPSAKSNGVLPGKASAAAAKHLLAKVYLTRAGSLVAQPNDYENAYLTAKEVIDNKGSLGLGLLPDYKDIHAEGNETSTEVLWTVQHTSNIPFNGPNNSGGADNVLNHMWVPQYEKKPGMVRSMEYGRPYIRCTPTLWLVDTAFKEKINDTRYNKTFQTVWYANDPTPGNYPVWPNPLPAGAPANAVAGQPKFKLGDTAIYMPGVAKTKAQVDAAPYLLIPLKSPAAGYVGYDNTLGPTLIKYFDTRRANLNDPSVRPVIVYRLAETYLMAAEAAFRTSRLTEAVDYINAVRERAAFPSGNATAMRITTTDLNIDFILDERTRELCGENVRWWDLVRTNKLLERIRLHNVDAQKNIQNKHIVRPIPQAQIDATSGEQYNFSMYFPGWN